MNLIDTHSHIYDDAFAGDRDEVVRRAVDAGIRYMLLPAVDSDTHNSLLSVCRDYPDICVPMMGLHPTSVNDNPGWTEELALVEEYLDHPPVGRFCAIGEVGLDLYWERKYLDEQVEAFERQIRLSLEYSLPLVIHTRDAWPEMVNVLSKYRHCGLRGIMHSFAGSLDDYNSISEFGEFLFGIGGPVTYKNSRLATLL